MAQPQSKINYHIARNMVINPHGGTTSRTLINPNPIPRELRQYPQFVCWRYEPVPDSKPLKIPVNPRTLGNAGPNWKNTWSDIRKAVKSYQDNPNLAGIGFVVTSNDPYVVIDLDNHLTDGQISQYAGDIVDTLNTYAEISPSGCGLRLIVRCRTLPKVRKADDLGFEMYSTARFATLTGNVYGNNPIASFDDLEWLIDRFAPRPKNERPPTPTAEERHFSFSPMPDDAALWKRMFSSRAGDKIRRLYDGVTADYATPSNADLALCARLLYWTRGDLERVDRMFRQSKLYRPDKWDRAARQGETYGQGTIRRAISTQTYTGGAR